MKIFQVLNDLFEIFLFEGRNPLDLNGDGKVNLKDLVSVFGLSSKHKHKGHHQQVNSNQYGVGAAPLDLNGDGIVDIKGN